MTDFICQKRLNVTMVTVDYCNNCCKDEPDCKKYYLIRVADDEIGWYNYPSNLMENEKLRM